jgi:hypothetical protein
MHSGNEEMNEEAQVIRLAVAVCFVCANFDIHDMHVSRVLHLHVLEPRKSEVHCIDVVWNSLMLTHHNKARSFDLVVTDLDADLLERLQQVVDCSVRLFEIYAIQVHNLGENVVHEYVFFCVVYDDEIE